MLSVPCTKSTKTPLARQELSMVSPEFGGTQPICEVVQRLSSAHDAQGGHTGRDSPRPPSDLSLPASGTADTFGTGPAVCAAVRAHSWMAGPAAETDGGESRRPKPSANRHGPARRVKDEPGRCLSRWRTAPSIEGLVSRVYVGASVETQGDLALLAILPAEARVSESFLLSSQFSLAEFNAPCRLAPESVANSRAIRYTQPTASPNFSMGRHTIQSTMEELLAGKPASSLPTIRVVEYRGQLYTLDNRRLVAFQNSGLNEIPIRRLSMSDPGVAKEFWRKFNPIEGGTKIVITPNADRAAAEALLREMGKTK